MPEETPAAKRPPVKTYSLVFKTILRPNNTQAGQLRQCIGASRLMHNQLVAYLKADATTQAVRPKEERTYAASTPFALREKVRKELKPALAWQKELPGDPFEWGADTVAAAIKAKKEGRTKTIRYRKKGQDNTTSFGTNSRLLNRGRTVRLPKLGEVRLGERLKAAAWLVKCGGKLTAVTVRERAGRWEVVLRIKVTEPLYHSFLRGKHYGQGEGVVGLDAGLKTLYTLSEGLSITNPRFFRQERARVKQLQRELAKREGPKQGGRKRPSKAYQRKQEELQKVHKRVTDRRANLYHQLSRKLVDRYAVVGIEDLNILGMLRNKRLAGAISDASWATFTGMLTYKLERTGGTLVRVGRFDPTSKACSACGTVKAKLSLAERAYECEACGLVIDRDLNASVNIENAAGYAVGLGLHPTRVQAVGSNAPLMEPVVLDYRSLCGRDANPLKGKPRPVPRITPHKGLNSQQAQEQSSFA